MAVREALAKNKPLAMAVCVILFGGVIGLRFWSTSNDIPGPLTQAYYSDDDGKTYFVDDSAKICPFDHNGKQAVRAVLFRYGSGNPFVAYLSQYSKKDQKRLTELRAMPLTPDIVQSIRVIANSSMEVKKPGDKKWVPINSADAPELINQSTLAGETGDLTSVEP
jgi:hypothetical protein